jgi:hypothetical protein
MVFQVLAAVVVAAASAASLPDPAGPAALKPMGLDFDVYANQWAVHVSQPGPKPVLQSLCWQYVPLPLLYLSQFTT